MSKHQLTAVVRDEKDHTIGYLGVDEQGLNWALNSEDAWAAVSGGLSIVVKDDDDNEGIVVLGQRRGTPYLKTYPNDRIQDNILEQLIVHGKMPEVTGLGLG